MKLVAVLETLTFKTIKAKFYLVGEKVENVTEDLYAGVQEYNKIATTKIPYSLKNGVITYSFGCGLTHYLQQSNLLQINMYTESDLSNASLSVLTPDDCKNILKVTAKSDEIQNKLLEYYKITI